MDQPLTLLDAFIDMECLPASFLKPHEEADAGKHGNSTSFISKRLVMCSRFSAVAEKHALTFFWLEYFLS